MKLARPDVRHPRIVLAGQVAGHAEDDGLVAALRARGLHAHWASWKDSDTLNTDLVILQASTDYHERPDEFLRWTRRVPNLLNAPDVVAWNADKHYLHDLKRAGVPTAEPSAGETALVFLGGVQSHAFTSVSSVEPDFEIWDLGYRTLEAAAEQLSSNASELLYARVDVIGEPGEAWLVGLDLIAPPLGWHLLGDATRADAQRQFALCVERALERLGLGPFSHRRP